MAVTMGYAIRSYSLSVCLLGAGIGLAMATADARERAWFGYTNGYFEAYSDAPKKKVLRLLGELENFRAAVQQVVKFEVPAGAVKTQVFVFDSKSDFRKVASNRTTDAFAMGMGGVPYIVLPVAGASNWAMTSIRHEYAHVLMGYSGHRFPPWYEEGFAEFMSGTRFLDDGTRFTFGDVNGRIHGGSKLVAWDELMGDDFDFHARSSRTVSDAYFQAWVLVHYMTLGDQLAHHDELGVYLGRYSAGESSLAALDAAFGMDPETLGRRVIDYSGDMKAFILDFRPGIQDHAFRRFEADPEVVHATIAEIGDAVAAIRER